MPSSTDQKPISWDIDTYLNRLVPRPRLHLLPKPISRFLGHRETPIKPISQPLVWFWSFFGAFVGIICASLLFRIPYLVSLSSTSFNTTTPSSDVATHLIIIGSLGASAILEYNTITSPLAQPRNAILGQGLSAVVGISVIRLFGLMNDDAKLESLRWVAGALAVGISSALMGMTKTVHPPAGATSLLAATSPQVGDLGWLLVPVVMAASTIMIVVALIINNIQRQFPMWWWTELPLTPPEKPSDEESGSEIKKVDTSNTDSTYVSDGKQGQDHWSRQKDKIVISASRINIPDYLQLSTEELAFLEVLKQKFEIGNSDRGSECSERTAVH